MVNCKIKFCNVRNVIKSGNSNQIDPSSNNDLFLVEISGKNNLIGI